MPIDRLERPLTDSERRKLERRMRAVEKRQTSALLRTSAASATGCALLCVATLLASDAPRIVVLLFWGAMTIALTLRTGLSTRREFARQMDTLRECLRHDRARVMRLRAERVVTFEEIEDEGACYAFQVEPDQILIVQGQDFYPDESFPNSDFSLVEILTAAGAAGDVMLVRHGERLRPERWIDASVKDVLEIPEHLQMVRGDVADIENLLASHTPA